MHLTKSPREPRHGPGQVLEDGEHGHVGHLQLQAIAEGLPPGVDLPGSRPGLERELRGAEVDDRPRTRAELSQGLAQHHCPAATIQ